MALMDFILKMYQMGEDKKQREADRQRQDQMWQQQQEEYKAQQNQRAWDQKERERIAAEQEAARKADILPMNQQFYENLNGSPYQPLYAPKSYETQSTITAPAEWEPRVGEGSARQQWADQTTTEQIPQWGDVSRREYMKVLETVPEKTTPFTYDPTAFTAKWSPENPYIPLISDTSLNPNAQALSGNYEKGTAWETSQIPTSLSPMEEVDIALKKSQIYKNNTDAKRTVETEEQKKNRELYNNLQKQYALLVQQNMPKQVTNTAGTSREWVYPTGAPTPSFEEWLRSTQPGPTVKTVLKEVTGIPYDDYSNTYIKNYGTTGSVEDQEAEKLVKKYGDVAEAIYATIAGVESGKAQQALIDRYNMVQKKKNPSFKEHNIDWWMNMYQSKYGQ